MYLYLYVSYMYAWNVCYLSFQTAEAAFRIALHLPFLLAAPAVNQYVLMYI